MEPCALLLRTPGQTRRLAPSNLPPISGCQNAIEFLWHQNLRVKKVAPNCNYFGYCRYNIKSIAFRIVVLINLIKIFPIHILIEITYFLFFYPLNMYYKIPHKFFVTFISNTFTYSK